MPTEGGNRTAYGEWWFAVTSPSNSNISGLDLCSLDGVYVGVPILFTPGFEPDICFPETIAQIGSAMYAVGPPLRDWVELGSFQGAAPFLQNETWANLTPDRLTDIGYLNFSSGAYVYGEVYFAGTTLSPSSFTVQACSTDETSVCGPVSRFPWSNSPSQHDLDAANMSLVGCPNGTADFCVAAPPGPVELTVAGGNFTENVTWAEIPSACCAVHPKALALNGVTSDHVRSINVSASAGAVSGRVVAGPGTFEAPLDAVTVLVCPVAPGSPACSPGAAENTTFSLSAPLGWDEITVQAPGYLPNSTWVDVNGTVRAGTIVLTPLATISGRVVDPNGTGIAGAVLQYCPLASVSPPQPGCQRLQTPQVGSSGYYVGGVPGGPFPGSTYELSASASGYLTNFTWLNATPGELFGLPPIVLTPVGNGGTLLAPPPSVPRPSGTPGTWVVGRLVNGRSGVGVASAFLSACTYSNSVCVSFSDLTGTGGQFNESVPLGVYHLFADLGGYSPGVYYLNATSTAPVDLGALDFAPYPFVSGRIAISAWTGYSKSAGFGPGSASVQVCNSGQTECGTSTELNSAGAFNITAPPGVNDALTVTGDGGSPFDGITGQGAQGGGAGGWTSNLTPVTVNTTDVRLSQAPGVIPVLGLFTAEQGVVLDGSSPRDRSGTPSAPARWASVTTTGPLAGASIQMYVGGGGNFTVFVPPLEPLRIVAGGAAFLYANATSTVPSATGSNGAPSTSSVAPLVLPHFGWVEGRVESNGGVPVPFASVTVSRWDPGNRTTISVAGSADGDGFLNLSAPPGALDNLTVSAGGFLSQHSTASVTSSVTTHLLPWHLTPAYTVEYARSQEVNDVSVPPRITLVDPTGRAPIAGASLELLDGGANLESVTTSNGLGQFLLAGASASVTTLSVFRTGYESRSLALPAPIQGEVVFPSLNLTGDGVLAGRVVAAPASTPTPGVNVTACEVYPNGGCETVTSNGAGLFGFEVAPGVYRLNLSAEGFSVDTTYGAQASTDVWTWIGNLTVSPDGIVSGHVVGDPFDLAIEGANVTLCPTNGSFSIDCAFSTPTDLTGGFALSSPPGLFDLNLSAPGYGHWSLEVELSPGQHLDLGAIVLSPDGGIFGSVVDAVSRSPIPSADVSACPSDGGGCVGPVSTDLLGHYLLPPLDPGPATLYASASGYSPAYRSETVPAGGTLVATPIELYPVGVLPQFDVSGTVVWNATGSAISGATVSAGPVGGGFGPATVTRPNGSFLLSLTSGPYRLTVSAPGAVRVSVALSVGNASIRGLVLPLDRTTYPVTGSVLAEGTGAPIVGASVSAGSTASTLTGPSGRFHLDLPNGSYDLSARPVPGPLALEFSPVTLVLSVNGAGATVNFTLPSAAQSLQILAVDAETGLGVGGAQGAVSGRTSAGTAEQIAVTADGGGTIALSLPNGQYTITLDAPGYSSTSTSFSVNGSTPPVVVSLVPTGAGRAAQGGITAPEAEWAIAAGIGAVAVVLFALGRRRGGPRGPDGSEVPGVLERPGPERGPDRSPPADRPVSLPPEEG
ncbi:MAG TPA: carboxypeptidase-like regulatory domain-containing protein [Thermoplasmata archaeon]|nr:carboxypeptidase-like regulatory domain-containing protein [Thermoplasmata archaeon]